MFKKLSILFFTLFVCCFANGQLKPPPEDKKDDFQIFLPKKPFDNPIFTPKQQEPKKVEPPKTNSKKPTLVHLEWADVWAYDQALTGDAQVLTGNVTFSHDGVFLYCDSACWYQANNSFNAFGNVLINQGDTLFVYGDVLFYDGNTKLARLRENVLMDNLSATLVTDSFNYDRARNVGYYFDGGVLQDTLNTLTSETGYYYPSTKDAVFRHDVVLTNPDFIMTSDTLRYNVNTKVAFIVGPTNILYDKETHIYSEYGWYNTDNEQSKLLKNSYVFHDSGKKLVADTIFYDKKNGRGEGFTNVVINDTVKKVSLHGHYGYYIEKNEIGLVTDSAMMIEYSSEDTLFLHADTLYTRAETFQFPIVNIDTVFVAKNSPAKEGKTPLPFGDGLMEGIGQVGNDSIVFIPNDTIIGQNEKFSPQNDTVAVSPPPDKLKKSKKKPKKQTITEQVPTPPIDQADNDIIQKVSDLSRNDSIISIKKDTVWQDSTYKIFQGYPNVRFWRTNVQGVCDSSYYNTRDSVLHLLKKPIIWSDNRQLTGDTIRIYPKNGAADRVVVTNNAFVSEFVEDTHFNQVSGKEIVGFIVEEKLRKVDVKGNAESIYYPQDEEDKAIIGQVKTISSIMNIYFADDKIERINMSPNPSGSMYPLKDVTDDMLYMKNYSWQISKRPISKYDIFRNTNAVVRDSLSNEKQNVDIQPKKKTTRRDDVKSAEEETIAQKKQTQGQTRSTDANRPSGFATPSFGGSGLGSGSGKGGGGALQRKQY